MDTRICDFVEAMFLSLPATEEAQTAKQSLLEHTQEKYEELLQQGKNPDEAFGIVVAQFGSIEELRHELGASVPGTNSQQDSLWANYTAFKKKEAFLSALCVCMYILSPCMFLLFYSIHIMLSLFLFLLCIAVPTGIFVYLDAHESYYKKQFGIKKSLLNCSSNNPQDAGKAPAAPASRPNRSWSGAIFLAAICIYLILGFAFQLWHPGWIVFLIACLVIVVHNTLNSAGRPS